MVGFGQCCCSPSVREAVGEFFAEFLGTFLLVFIGNSAVAESVLTEGTGGNTVTVYVGYGLGLFLGILVSGGVSVNRTGVFQTVCMSVELPTDHWHPLFYGWSDSLPARGPVAVSCETDVIASGHLNPAVTVAGAMVGKFKRSKVFHYLTAQYLGAFVAACFTYLVYIDTFESVHDRLGGMDKATAGIFATYPKEGLSIIGSIIDQILGSMVLILGIYAATDERNGKVPVHLVPIYVALTLIGIACSLGVNQGFAVNPARDLSPRFFTFLAGWGSQVFSSSTYWYVPIIGPHIGALLGALLYVSLVEKMRASSSAEEDFMNLPPPEIKQFSYVNPSCSSKDEYPLARSRDIYSCYL